MRPLTEPEVRDSFVNALPAELDRLALPWWFDAALWDSLDYLGWVDPALPERAYLVVAGHDRPTGVVLRLPKNRPQGHRALCNLCWTQHKSQGAVLMVARRAGDAGLNHNTIGTYVCADLACSAYVRGLQRSFGGGFLPETLDPDLRIARLQENVASFVGRIAAGADHAGQ